MTTVLNHTASGVLQFKDATPRKKNESFTMEARTLALFRPDRLFAAMPHSNASTSFLSPHGSARALPTTLGWPAVLKGRLVQLTLVANCDLPRGFCCTVEGIVAVEEPTTWTIDVTDEAFASKPTERQHFRDVPHVVQEKSVLEVAKSALDFLSGLNLQDHSVAEQRQCLEVVRDLMSATRGTSWRAADLRKDKVR